MRWLSQKTIIAAAKESDLAALKCSKKHWEQLRDASFEEIRKADRKAKASTGDDFCACCKRFVFWRCPLASSRGCGTIECCDGLYSIAHKLHRDVLGRAANKNAWVKTCQNLIDFIEEKIEEVK